MTSPYQIGLELPALAVETWREQANRLACLRDGVAMVGAGGARFYQVGSTGLVPAPDPNPIARMRDLATDISAVVLLLGGGLLLRDLLRRSNED